MELIHAYIYVLRREKCIKKIFHVSDISAFQPAGGSRVSFLKHANISLENGHFFTGITKGKVFIVIQTNKISG